MRLVRTCVRAYLTQAVISWHTCFPSTCDFPCLSCRDRSTELWPVRRINLCQLYAAWRLVHRLHVRPLETKIARLMFNTSWPSTTRATRYRAVFRVFRTSHVENPMENDWRRRESDALTRLMYANATVPFPSKIEIRWCVAGSLVYSSASVQPYSRQ